mgnify:FL=1|tara:strand:+ start:65 stop:334 length:270 start_codon:yes stop_codon:yes gene_type:complete
MPKVGKKSFSYSKAGKKKAKKYAKKTGKKMSYNMGGLAEMPRRRPRMPVIADKAVAGGQGAIPRSANTYSEGGKVEMYQEQVRRKFHGK